MLAGLLFLGQFFAMPALADSDNLIQNATFQQKLAGWKRYTWVQGEGDISSENDVLTLTSDVNNHLMLQQEISVQPKKTYRFRVMAKADILAQEGDLSAFIGVDYTSINAHVDLNNSDWQQLEFYGKTLRKQKNLTLNLSLGGYGSLASGTVSYKDLEVVQVDDVPEGALVQDLETWSTNDSTEEGALPNSIIYGELLRTLLFAIIGAALVYGVYRWGTKGGWCLSEKVTDVFLVIIVVLGFILRVVLTVSSKGHSTDTNTFAFWMDRIVETGPRDFYSPDIFCDYPPGLMYLFWFMGMISKALGIVVFSSGDGLLMMMLPTLICDIAIVILAYNFAKKRWNNIVATAIALILCFLPAILYDGAVWHQVDSILALGLVVVFMLLHKKRYYLAAAVYGLAVLMKPQALMAGPVFAIAYILMVVDAYQSSSQKKKFEAVLRGALKILLSAVIAFGVIFLLSLPFKGDQEMTWIIDKYYQTGTSYPYASVNAYNFFTLIGANYADQATVLFGIPGTNFGISYEMLGNFFILLAVVITIYFAIVAHKKRRVNYYLLSAFLLMAIFCFGPRMHERYAFPVMILLAFAWLESKDKGVMRAFIAISAAQFANIAVILFSSNNALPNTLFVSVIVAIISLAQVISCIYLFLVCCDVCFRKTKNLENLSEVAVISKLDEAQGESVQNKEKDHKTEAAKFNPFYQAKKSLDMPGVGRKKLFSRKDKIFVLAITIVYGIIAFVNLGTTKVPQNYWRGNEGEMIVLDFGGLSQVSSIWSYGGIGDGEISLAPVEAMDSPISEFTVNYDVMFRWNVVNLETPATVDQLLLTVKSGDVWLNEIVFVNEQNEVVPVQSVTHMEMAAEELPAGEESVLSSINDPDSKVDHLVDEAEYKPERPDVLNGMYFDELYHGRTALEHLKHMKPYEYTHPPLGKVFIMVGIATVGMNPFGWRCIGTLFGVAMVPIFYALAKRLLKNTNYAAFATVLFTFDFMHFVQTRIATIDVYGVFFILLMYYFMLKYWQMNFYTDGLKKTLLPLGLSGLFFALGAASKWICIYAGIGLAIILFASLYKRYKEYVLARTALERVEPGSAEAEAAKKYVDQTSVFSKNLIKTLAFCVVMFVIVPVAVYLLSYIPFYLTAEPNKYDLRAVLELQKSMFSYHDGLTERHPFESNWISWIFDERPIWYYMGDNNFLPDGKVASIAAFGNPIVWWLGLVGLITTIIYSVKKKFSDPAALFIIVGFAAQFIPWTMITRATFIYHYFASVPFIILALAYMLKKWEKEKDYVKYIRYAIMIATVALFIVYYPALSGLPISDSYAKMLELLPRWRFFAHR